jgi:starch synthase
MGDRWRETPSIFTIHNLAYQGVLDEGSLDRLHLPREAYNPFVLWHEDRVNLMKGATALADRITTVSPTYAKEILTPENGFGLDGHLRAHAARVRGIVNGIDVARFDPSTDLALAARYDAASFAAGRAACRAALLEEAKLDPNTSGPIFGAVTRLTWQKGIDLLLPVFGEIVESGGSIVVVGQGEAELEAQLLDAMDHHPGRVCVRIAFDPPLSRRIYAGADFFLMPSRFEPCGLTQMYAMRYGSLPIVTDVGGLHDTVEPIVGDSGTGFVAAYPGIDALRLACDAALELHADAPAHARAIGRAMRKDFSWTAPAREYSSLFDEVIRSRG